MVGNGAPVTLTEPFSTTSVGTENERREYERVRVDVD